jgi:Mg-chelatase subunit ChlD
MCSGYSFYYVARVVLSTTAAGRIVPTYVWTLVVLVLADGEWRDWNSYGRAEECLEIAQAISYRKEDVLQVKCERREVK